jgi:hypothetical protein
VEGDGLGLDLALLNVDLVSGENDGDVLANTNEIACDLSIRGIAQFSRDDVRCQLGTFLYVIREVTSNMMIPHCPLM